jgi:hypothetical protein
LASHLNGLGKIDLSQCAGQNIAKLNGLKYLDSSFFQGFGGIRLGDFYLNLESKKEGDYYG